MIDPIRPDPLPGLTPVLLGPQELPGWRIENPHCRALISTQGAQVLSFQTGTEPPLLWLSEQAVYAPGKAIRGGIPLCFPWFGPHPDDHSKPAHGFARNRPWQLTQATQGATGHRLVFALRADAATLALWPHAFLAELMIELGRELQLTLTVHNTGPQPFTFTHAFHSYFPVAAIEHACVDGLDGSQCIDQLALARTPTPHHGPVRCQGETDRIYVGAGGRYRIKAPPGGGIRIGAPGCHSAIVWNPGQAKTARLGDMAADAWRGMICVECGNVESDTVTVAAGASAACGLTVAAGSP